MKGPNDALAKYQMLAGSYFSIEPPVPVSTFIIQKNVIVILQNLDLFPQANTMSNPSPPKKNQLFRS